MFERKKQVRGLAFCLMLVLICGSVLYGCGKKKDEKKEGIGSVGVLYEEYPAEGFSVSGNSNAGEASSDGQTEEENVEDTNASEAESGSNGALQDDVNTIAEADAEYVIVYSADNSWGDGSLTMYGTEIAVENHTGSTVDGWEVELTIPGVSEVTGWNGNFTITGDRMTITDAGYNAQIPDGGSATAGCNLGVAGDYKITAATVNGKTAYIRKGNVSQGNATSGNNGGGNSGGNESGTNGGNGAASNVDVEEMLLRCEDAVQGDDWLHTDGNRIYDRDGRQVWLTGVNWFGYNTGTNLFDGLWNSQLVPTVKAIADHGFNLIRVPISAQLINEWSRGEYPRANYNNAYNEELNSMNSLEIFEYFLKLAEANGIKVMMDIHSANTDASGHNVNLWYTDQVSVEDYYHALEWMADRYKQNDTIIAYDLKNEPHGKPFEGDGAAIWNDSPAKNNWKYTAEQAAGRILACNPNVLIMVEGTEIFPMNLQTNSDYHSTDSEDYYFNWWGGNLRGVKYYPVDLGRYQDKLVYSPHDYGPTVYEQPWFQGGYDFDSLMKDCWHDNWFYIHEENIAPILIGEWGGFMREPNLTWMTYMRKLIKDNRLNHTFWCLNANSGDTGGLLLDDFTTWDQEKYEFVKEVLWQENGKFVGLDHAIALGDNGVLITQIR